MNIKHVVILSVMFLAIFSLACVSAEENATDEDIANDINVTFDEQMWEENLTDIAVDLPENASGEFSVKINDEVIYNQTIVNKSFNVPIKLPKKVPEFVITIYPPMDYKSYKVSAFYNNVELNITKMLKVMKYSPEVSYLTHFPSEVLQHEDANRLRYSLMLPRSSNGFIELYLDNELLNKTRVRGPYIDMDLSKIVNSALGNHTLRVIYYNDTYYNPFNRTFEFEVVNAVITIPQRVNLTHDDCISVDVKTQSTVQVFLDGKLIASGKTDSYGYVLSLEEYLKRDSREVKVIVSNKDFTRQKTVLIDVCYDFDVYSQTSFIYGEESVIELSLPDILNNKLLTILIDGKKCSFTHPSYIVNNIIEVDVSKIGAGNHTMFISYLGDDRLKAKNKTVNFSVVNKIVFPYSIEFKDGSVVYLNLPKEANGNLTVYVNGVLFKSLKLVNGHAEVKLDRFAPGVYMVNASYSGNDFDVDDESVRLYVSPKITIDCYFRVGDKKSIILEVPKDCEGVMIVSINEKQYEVPIKNGKAVFSLKNLKIGEYDVDIEFKGKDGYSCSDYFYVEVIKAKIKIQAKNVNLLFNHKYKYKIKLLGKKAQPLKNKWITFKIGKKTYRVKTNKKGIAAIKLPKLDAKKYKIKISYGKVKVTRKISVSQIDLSDVKVNHTQKKLKLKAKLYKPMKSKKVTFKFKGKTYNAKTNSKGVAKVSIKLKDLKAGKTIKYQATYLKSTVKKSVKVQ
jgi:hypothetical protein